MKKLVVFTIILTCLSFTYKSKKFKGIEGYVFIPTGVTEREGKKYSCHAFYMSDHEVTNKEYRTFLNQLKEDGNMGDYKKAYPDTTAWSSLKGYFEPMKEYYFTHPAYDEYPVVNVSKEGAKLYCEYLTDKYKKIYGDDVIYPFRLPTRGEWMYAASGGESAFVYAWPGLSLKDDDGNYRANFLPLGEHNITMTEDGPNVVADSDRVMLGADPDNAVVIAAAKSFEPNAFGLYNVCGNVAEMVDDGDIAVGGHWRSGGYDVRIESTEKFEKPYPTVGFRPVMTYVSERAR